jgi:hypothetical protein
MLGSKREPIEQYKKDTKNFFNQLYKKNEVTRKNGPEILTKTQHVDAQFSYFLN